MRETSIAQQRALAAMCLADPGTASRGQEPRRGLMSFLTWPFFLGILFGLTGPAADATAEEAPSEPAPEVPSVDGAAREGTLPPEPAGLSDWEPAGAVPDTYLNLLTRASPAGVAPATAEAPEPTLAELGDELVRGGSGGGGQGGGAHGTGVNTSDPAADEDSGDGSLTIGKPDLGALPVQLSLDLGEALPISGVLHAIGLDPVSDVLDDILDTLGDLPLVGGAVADIGDNRGDLAVSVEVGPLHLAASGDVSSGGTLHFGASKLGSGLDPLYAEGRYTDYGVAFKTSLADAVDAGTDTPGDVGIQNTLDLAHALEPDVRAGVIDQHADTTMRSPLDVLS